MRTFERKKRFVGSQKTLSLSNINVDNIPGLYDWQRDCLKEVIDKDAIVSAPTGSGKTKIAYAWMRPADAIKRKTHNIEI